MADRRLRSSLRQGVGQRRFGERSIITEGLKQSVWADPYHTALTLSWPRFLLSLALAFVAINLVFGALYFVGRDAVASARPGRFSDLFFFSVETFSTTGYGDMHPQTFYGHAVATAEIFVSLIATAGVTGLIFARFSRPRARLMFARNPVVSRHEGVETLMVRVVNARDGFISEATAKLWLLGPLETSEGRRFIGFRPMALLRPENPAFAMSWTLFHPIDAQSPLYGLSEESVEAAEINLVVSISGLDDTSLQTVHARNVYAFADLRWGHDFADMFYRDEQGRSHVDFSKVHDVIDALTSQKVA